MLREASSGDIDDRGAASKLESLRMACCHPQVGRTDSAFLGSKILTMPEISARLCERAAEELGASERDLCRALNELSTWYMQFDMWDKAEAVLTEGMVLEPCCVESFSLIFHLSLSFSFLSLFSSLSLFSLPHVSHDHPDNVTTCVRRRCERTHVVLCHVVLCCAVLCCVVLSCAVLCCAVLCCAVLCVSHIH